MGDEHPDLTATERHLARQREDDRSIGRLPDSSLYRERTIEAYLRSGFLPRYMERLRDIHTGIEAHRAELARVLGELRELHGPDRAALEAAWHERLSRWRFDDLNELIDQHNEWYPIERQLPIDPRTGEYVLIVGRPYRREPLTVDWALREFPA
jgi:hypothetical protein